MPDSLQSLLQIFHAALDAVSGARAVEAHLAKHPIDGNVHVIAIGKAAQAMAQGARMALGQQLRSGLLISKYHHTRPLAGFEIIESAHPLPDENSLHAGRALLQFIQQADTHTTLLFLISGGASALVEVLVEGLALSDLADINRRLLSQGKTIEEMNALRKQLSQIKGGKLARFVEQFRVVNLMISDVPGDDPRTIGSGLLSPAPGGEWQRAQAVAESLSLQLPGQAAASLPLALFQNIESHIIANNPMALAAAADKARSLGLPVVLAEGLLAGDGYECSRRCVEALRQGPEGVYLWGGETHLQLPPQPGRGGRNQAFALQAALAMEDVDGLSLLAAGTDGTDGPGEDCGGLVDGNTVERIREAGLDAGRALQQADSGTALAASGDLLQTGPTGTNVMDLVIGLKQASLT